MKRNRAGYRQAASCVIVALATLVSGCGGSDGGTSAPVAGTGTLSASLTDAPACGYDQVNVTVSKVRVHQSGSANENAAGWSEIVLPSPRKINLLDLNDPTLPNRALDYLGETPLPAGHYTQVRLVLVPNRGNSQPFENSIVLEGQAQEIELDTPSAVQSGIKLINEFDVPAGQQVDLVLDFDACKSIVQTGNGTYKLKPVIKVIPTVLNGIDGYLDPVLFPGQLNVNHVAVSAQVNGEVVRTTRPNETTGRFLLGRLVPGTYDVVITGDDRATKVISGVPVASATSITSVSPVPPSTALLTLAPSVSQNVSGTATLTPATDDGTVVVAARQLLSSGPTVTVKSQVAQVKTDPAATVGDYGYVLRLPVAKPWLGAYTAALPIVFAEQPAAVAGNYRITGTAQTDTVSMLFRFRRRSL